MFYSQFILAKKGPLGTIWIAAHLERKLRKNQVADTDIGVSVDSILFPDAPIALRLSSHLLLGVVRIYSKKVNYLFNDCSEALIKIKHAFRSTAVDLPPEESTAPYHSITLPENFDLDNFELPDSAFLDSNFVDHHVSTREQITLQDTVNDIAFPTSKFGLDERFGDEDASPIGLELDEELFINNKISTQDDDISMSSKVSGLHHGETSVASTRMALDVQFERHEEKHNEIPNELSALLSNNYDKNCFSSVEDLRKDVNYSHRHGYTIQTPDLNEIFQPDCPTALSSHISFTIYDVQTPCLVERAQEPSTPALLEEVIPSHLQVPALSPQEKDEIRVESVKPGSSSPYMEIDCSEEGNKTIHARAKLDYKSGEAVLPLSSALTSPMSESLTPTHSNCNLITDNACLVSETECQQSIFIGNKLSNISTSIHRFDNEDAINPSVFSHEVSLTSPPNLAALFEAKSITSNICTDNMDVSVDILDVKRTSVKGNETTEIVNSGHVEDGKSCISTSLVGSDIFSRSCGSNYHLPSSPFMQTAPFKVVHATSNICTNSMDVSGGVLDVRRMPLEGSNEQTEVANFGHLEDGHSCASTSVVGSDFISRSYGSDLHIPSSPFLQTALFEAEPATSSICTDNMTASRDILDVKCTPGNIPNGLAILEDGHSSVNTSVVGSDFRWRCSGSNMHLPSSPFIHTASFDTEPATSNICVDNMDASRVNLDSKRTLQNDSNEIYNLGCGEDVGPDFLSRSCSSNMHLPSSIFVDGALGESSELSHRDHFFSQKTPMREDGQHVSRSFEVQGEGFHCTNDQFINLEGQNISGYTTSDFKYSARKPNELSVGVASKVNHLDNENSSSSEFLEPEKMLAPSFVDFPTFQALQGEDKGAMQSDRFVDKNSSQYSRKRTSMDSPSIPQTSTSSRLSILPSIEKRRDYIPDDDDVLTTILDGRMTSSLKTGSIPPLSLKTSSIPPRSSKTGTTPPLSSKTDSIPSLSKPSSQKRPRTMSKVGMPRKRKVLVDDAMVLHADAIRQQLINTEDIRRMRKKAPCTRPEIWKIYTSAMDDDIFDRSILAGISTELNSLCNLKNDIQKDPSSTELNSQVKTSGETVSSRVSELLKEMDDKKMNERSESVHSTVNKNDGPSQSASVQTGESDMQVDLYDQLQKLPAWPQAGLFRNDPASVIGSSGALKVLNDMSIKDWNQRISSVHINKNDGAPATMRTHEVGAECDLDDQVQKLPVHSNDQASIGSTVLEFLNEMGDNAINERILSVHGNDGRSSMNEPATVQAHEVDTQYNMYDQFQKLPVQLEVGSCRNDQTSVLGSSRAFLNGMGEKERNERISSVHSTNRNDGPSNITASLIFKTTEVSVQCDLHDQFQKLPGHSSAGPCNNNQSSVIESSTGLEFFSEMGDKKNNGRILSVHRNDAPSSMNESTTVQTHEVGAQYNLYDQLQMPPVQPQVGPFRNDQVSSRALEFVNEMDDKQRNERISFAHCANRKDGNITASATMQNNEVSAQHDLYDQLQKPAIHSPEGSFINNQLSRIGSSAVLELHNEMGDKEFNERVVSVHRNGPSNMNESARVQTCEVGVQYDLYDQLEKLPIQSQVGSFRHAQGTVICSMQPGAETCSTSFIQETSISELNKGTGSSWFSGFSSDKGDMEMNERISSVPSIVDRDFSPSSLIQSARVQTHESGAHYDMYGQLNKLSVQSQVGPFNNDKVSASCSMHPNVETHPNSIIRETLIRKCVSSDESNQPVGYNSRVKEPGATGSLRVLDFPNEMSGKEMNGRISSVPIIDGTSIITSSTTVPTNKADAPYDVHDQLGKLPTQLEVGPFSYGQVSLTCLAQVDGENRAEIVKNISSVENLTNKSINFTERLLHSDAHNLLNTPDDRSVCTTFSGIDGAIVFESSTSKSLVQTENICNAVGAIIKKEESGNVMDTKHSESVRATDVDAGGEVLYMQDRLLVNRGTEFLEETDGSAILAETVGAVEALRDGGRTVIENRDEGMPVSDVTCAEQNIAFFSSSVNPAPSTLGENNRIKDFKHDGGMNVYSMPVDIGAARDSSDFSSAIDDNYTGFLNEDDEAIIDEAGDTALNPEDAQAIENSGWSARTRGVAKYLKNLFDEESGQGRKVIAVNRLLVGKTRKEASRMFFETLVLKTRDYIQVEQEKPYEHINIIPRIKLLKSEF